jgi:hypothetical protein
MLLHGSITAPGAPFLTEVYREEGLGLSVGGLCAAAQQ